jgi:hypothetical protein
VVQFITKGKKDRVCFIVLQQLTQIVKQILFIHAIAMMVTREQGNVWILPIVLTKIPSCQRVWRDGGGQLGYRLTAAEETMIELSPATGSCRRRRLRKSAKLTVDD